MSISRVMIVICPYTFFTILSLIERIIIDEVRLKAFQLFQLILNHIFLDHVVKIIFNLKCFIIMKFIK